MSTDARRFHDISAPLDAGLVTWPGEHFDRSLQKSLEAGDGVTVSQLHLGAHNGTHVDAACHFIAGASGIEAVPLEALVGPAFVVEVPADQRVITAGVLDAAGVPPDVPRLLARTANSGWTRRSGGFDERYVAFDESAAAWCLERGVVLVGIDYLSIEPFDAGEHGHPVHHLLLGAGVVVLEGLELVDVRPGGYELVALPVLIPGSDGAPTRAVLVDQER